MGDSPSSLPRYAVGADYSTKRVHLALMARDRVAAERIVDLPKNRPGEEFTLLRLALREIAPHGVTVIAFEEPFVNIRTDGSGKEQTNHQTAIMLQRTATFIECAGLAEGMERVYRLGATVWRPIVGVRGHRREELKKDALSLVRVSYGLDCGTDDNRAEAILIGFAALTLARRDGMVEAAGA